ncbi:hypothetical protein GN958_ATG03771 [Phytophthora infestans]|uniref:Uncharacterized protein n=1 Tax=Phytophthora infestans TaxID=4787 RepID=A0A8S9V2I3_PHYIN|nr:hypothetical protein GN958_ATG03771 [Phytophthora infestans]
MLNMTGLMKPHVWMHALEVATFLRNRSCQKATPQGPDARKLDNNCRIGFVVGYLVDQPGYEVYFPAERVVDHVLHASINKEILYTDRYEEGYHKIVTNWLSSVVEDSSGGEASSSIYRSAIDEAGLAVEAADDPSVDLSKLPNYEELHMFPPAEHTHTIPQSSL